MIDGTKCGKWVSDINSVVAAVQRIGGECRRVTMEERASAGDVADVERALGHPLPRSFRAFLVNHARSLDVHWFLPQNERKGLARWFRPKVRELPDPLRGIFAGTLSFSLTGVLSCEKSRRGWIDSCFPNVEDSYDRVWHGKLAFSEVGNGDLLAFDLSTGEDAAVVYLSHDDGEGHGRRMANSFEDLMDRWSPLGCPGNEDWQWLPFADKGTGLIDPSGPTASVWHAWLGLVKR